VVFTGTRRVRARGDEGAAVSLALSGAVRFAMAVLLSGKDALVTKDVVNQFKIAGISVGRG
jgi:hypothetical protein